MKKALILLLAFLAGYTAFRYVEMPVNRQTAVIQSNNTDALLEKAFVDRTSNIQVEGRGKIEKLLVDDTSGSRHQKFIVRLESGRTLLIAHNIDLAPRIDNPAVGDVIAFFGEYEWNPKGGVIHWTHRDPDGRHIAGWLQHDGRTFQ